MKKLLLIFMCSLLVISCATKDKVVYFQEAEDLEGYENLMDYEPVIEENDVLRINISSQAAEEVVKPFQRDIQGQTGTGGGGGQNLSLSGYLVDPNGNIQYPILGDVEVAGHTRGEIQKKIQKQVRKYVTDAVIDVRLVNFKVTVLGEVGSPGRVQVQDERITLPELFAEVGDISYNGKRENIVVIREVNGVKSVGRVDMTKSDVFKNPFYYLKQNDVVYVEPTYRAVKSAGFITSYTGLISIVTTAFSLYLLFFNR